MEVGIIDWTFDFFYSCTPSRRTSTKLKFHISWFWVYSKALNEDLLWLNGGFILNEVLKGHFSTANSVLERIFVLFGFILFQLYVFTLYQCHFTRCGINLWEKSISKCFLFLLGSLPFMNCMLSLQLFISVPKIKKIVSRIIG